MTRRATVASLLGAAVLAAPAVAAAAQTRTCAEGSEAAAFDARRDLRAGPLWFYEGAGRTPKTRLSRRLYMWKVPIGVAAGRNVTVTVARRHRRRASLVGEGGARRLREGLASLRYESCAADAGGQTGWGGSILTSRGVMCLRLAIDADGEDRRRVVMPLGRRSCPRG
jgi:hypothetical protein